MIRHPSKRALRAWLQNEADEKVESHVSTCERCASVLEDLDEPRTDGAIGDTLARVLAPPTGLSQRLEVEVTARLDSRQVFGYMADLFGAGFETTRILLTEEPPDDPS